MADETIKLQLDLGDSTTAVEDLRQHLAGLKTAAKDVADTYEVLDRATGSYVVQARHEEHELDELVRKAVEATHAQRAMAAAMEELPGHTTRATAALGGLKGQSGANGQGLLGASYAIQDFVSVLTGGGGLGRAIGAVSNNIAPFALSLGAGGALAGGLGFLVTAFGAAIPIIEEFWGAVDSEASKKAVEKLKELQNEIKRTHDEFRKLAEAPTDIERESAEGIRLELSERGTAQQARAAVQKGITNKEAYEKLDKAAFNGFEKDATATDADIQRQAEIDAGLALPADSPQAARDAFAASAAKQARERRETAQRRRREMLEAARRAKAEEIVAGATVAGPAGEAARRRLLELTPEMRGLQAMSPERIAAAEAEHEAEEEAGGPGTEAFADRAREGVRARKKAEREQRLMEEEKRRGDARIEADRKRRLKQEEAEKERKAHAASVAANQHMDHLVGAVNATDLDELAAARAAELGAQGGYTDKFGRFHKAGRAGQHAALSAEIEGELGRRMPHLAPKERQALARRIASGGQAAHASAYSEAHAEATAQGMQGLAATQAAMSGAMQRMAAALQVSRQAAARADKISHQVQQPLANSGW